MDYYTQSLTLMGHVESKAPSDSQFQIGCRSGDSFVVHCAETTRFRVLRNIDGIVRDRTSLGAGAGSDSVLKRVDRYIDIGRLVVAYGVFQEHNGNRRFDARVVHILCSKNQEKRARSAEHQEEPSEKKDAPRWPAYLFEETHWWLTQIARLADEWLEDIFKDRRSYRVDDFAACYRTNLNLYGQTGDDTSQECATLSRLIYGLSSAFLVTGTERYFLAAKAGVEYQRQTFRRFSHDGQYCFWSHARRKLADGAKIIEPSLTKDDKDTIPLYEQIYALAGLAQYYRITLDWEVLEEIRRTLNAFNDFFRDDDRDRPVSRFPGHGGYFSHLDYVSMRPDSEALTTKERDNYLRKNWNSIGDHIPAYLVNLLLALDPLPQGRSLEGVEGLRDRCHRMLDETSQLILNKFVDKHKPKGEPSFVHERFRDDWEVDSDWGWQKDRGIVGHNLKIVWNLCRCANYYEEKAGRLERSQNGDTKDREEIDGLRARAKECADAAETLGENMAKVGLDQIRGGVFDVLERKPTNGMPMEFPWMNTKDFWQQEQGILAYLILHGRHRHDSDYQKSAPFLNLARETAAFWNLFFLDSERRGVFFRVTENGLPIIEGEYANKGGHSMSGYHVFELNYLAHLYTRMYLGADTGTDASFSLFFRPKRDCAQKSINVLPDFIAPGVLKIETIRVNGVKRPNFNPLEFQIPLSEDELGRALEVTFSAVDNKLHDRAKETGKV